MIIKSNKKFDKAYKKCPSIIQETFLKKLEIFKIDKYNPVLNNHFLSGKMKGFRSINITGDWRVIYKEVDQNTIFFITIGTHSQLYK